MKKITAVLLLLALLLGLTGCGTKADYAIKVGNQVVTENDYHRYIRLLRSNYLSANEGSDTPEFWAKESDEEGTNSEYLVSVANEQLINSKLYSEQFDKLGLTFSDEEQQRINASISEMAEAQGGMSAFLSYLESYDYTYDEYITEYHDILKKTKVLGFYFGEDGEDPVSMADIKAYYNVHNALVKVVYVLKVDKTTGEALDEAALEAAKEKADEALEAANRPSETDNFEDVIEIFSDYPSDKDSIVISDSAYDEKIAKAVLALEVGECTLLDTDDIYLVIKRYDGTADEVFSATMKQETLETIRAEEITELLEAWRKDTTVKINKKLIKNYTPEKLIGES